MLSKLKYLLFFVIILKTNFCYGYQNINTNRLLLGTDIEWFVLEDRNNELTINDVEQHQGFQKLEGGLSKGHNKNPFWLLFNIPKTSNKHWWLEVKNAYLDSVTVFFKNKKGKDWSIIELGDLHPFEKREIKHRYFVFNLENARQDVPAFIRIQSSGSINANIILWKPSAFIEKTSIDYFIAGGFFFLLFPVILISLYYGIFHHQPIFILFSGLIISIALCISAVNGFHSQFILKNSPIIAKYTLNFFLFITIGLFTLLSNKLLEIKQHFNLLGHFLNYLSYLILLMSLFAFSHKYYSNVISLVFAFHLITSIIFFCIALFLYWHKTKGSNYLIFLYSFSLVSVYSILVNLGVFQPNLISQYGWQANALSFVILSYVLLMQRLHQVENQSLCIQQQALLLSQKNELRLQEAISLQTKQLKKAHQDLKNAFEAEKKMRLEQRQFISMVTHELRTPLAVIDSAALMLKELPTHNPEEYLNQIQQGIKRIVRLINNCLTEDRLNAQSLVLQQETISTKQLIEDAAEIVTWSKHHYLDIKLINTPTMICVDSTLLCIALSNLFDNAIKYGAQGRVSISVNQKKDYLIFSVCDEGKGIPETELENIFKRYKRFNKKQNGVGLGLFVTREIAKLHGGDLTVKNLLNKGCCFELSIHL